MNYYLESRHVDDFDGLFELLICDRIKSSLSEACLRHVLSVENATERGWLDIDAFSVFFVDDNENDDENDEIVSNFRRRD